MSSSSEADAAPSGAEEAAGAAGAAGAVPDRQRVVRVRGSRRAKLTPAPGTTGEPVPADVQPNDAPEAAASAGPNDERMRRDVPPHY
ncbi:hypothetical protein ACFQRL_04600 [Microbacterium fluvii]|uniref:Uncharacterized protein n=1 Tax=Microbacterium fluvii TaxID=415215 RepID=A0ABW2HBL8_9MICO|nr:hypothetical protein [Microbacterium fluvii]MCU4671872.1 hypothetical protein [Microbacterium fluvii]